MKNNPGLILFSVWLLAILVSCKENYHRNKSYAQVPVSSIRKGESLARKHCASCHLLPDPSWADARSWEEGILPNMGPRLGIFSFNYLPYPSGKNDPNLQGNIYPEKPLLSGKEWQHILDYYTATSPDSLPPQQREQKPAAQLPFFTVQVPALSPASPAITFLRFDSSIAGNSLLSFDLQSQKLFRYNTSLQAVDSIQAAGCIVDAVVHNGKWLTCNIGNINPNNARLGSLQFLENRSGRFGAATDTLFQQLARPVEAVPADINNDGRMDYLVCEFGFVTGSLSWYENTAAGFQRRVIKGLPGAIKAYVRDENRDGLPDLWVLFAQGDETIMHFTNLGNGRFREEKVLQFPALQGSTFFELVDMNGDGREDIVYTCGDNADYSQTLKPYHGVYVYLNEGERRFTQSYFFPINGCFKALARDFDKDGDKDIAAIAFFADYATQPEESFVYLENKGGLRFRPYNFPESKWGRWLTLDAGDLDGDGWTDLVLGNFAAGPSFIPSPVDWRKGPAFLLLRNNAGR